MIVADPDCQLNNKIPHLGNNWRAQDRLRLILKEGPMEEKTVLLDTLDRLDKIGIAIRQLGSGDLRSYKTVLNMVTESASEVIPDSFADIYIYDEGEGVFDLTDQLLIEPGVDLEGEAPRPIGLGRRAVESRQRVLSYEVPDLEIHPSQAARGARAVVCYPLVFTNEVLGVLYINLRQARHFTDLELLMLGNFAHLAALTVSLARQTTLAQQEQNRKERELRRLRRAGMLISSRSSLKATLETILQVALEITDASYGIFRLVDRSGSNLVTQAISGIGLEKPAVENLMIDGNSIMGTVALKREPVVISDLRQSPWNQIYYPLDHELEMRSEVAVPLIGASGRLEGVLNLESPNVNAFDRQDRYILQILATQAVVAIQEARLLDALQEISALLPTQSIEVVHQTLVERACDLLNVSYGLIWLKDDDNLLLTAATDSSLRGLRIAIEGTLTGEVINEGRSSSILIASEELQREYADLPGFSGKGSALIVPLGSSGQLAAGERVPLGALGVFTNQSDLRDFDQSDWDKKVLTILGHYAALAMQSEAQKEALRIAEEQRATTEAFAAIGDIAANLLHRLNNKIGTIPVRVEGIQDKCQQAIAKDSYLDKNLNEIDRSASEAMQVVRETLFHLHPIQLAPVSVAASVREALGATRLPDSVQVMTEGLDLLPPVQAGPKRLGLVFTNLLENASDAMGGSGIIQVRGSAFGGWVFVKVSDNGPGIAPELHEKIFEFNYSSRASSHPGKLGFGLWWVKSLMARFGGTVSVESDGKNGTTFILSLPQAKEEAWRNL